MSTATYNTSIEFNDSDGDFIHDVEIDLRITQPSSAPSGEYGPPEFYNPGETAEFEVDEIRITYSENPAIKPVIMSAHTFEMMFPQSSSILEMANEWACENESDFHDF